MVFADGTYIFKWQYTKIDTNIVHTTKTTSRHLFLSDGLYKILNFVILNRMKKNAILEPDEIYHFTVKNILHLKSFRFLNIC